MLGFFEEFRDSGGNLPSDLGIISVARARTHFTKASPHRPIAEHQPLSVCGPDQIGKGQPINFIRRSGRFPEIPPLWLSS